MEHFLREVGCSNIQQRRGGSVDGRINYGNIIISVFVTFYKGIYEVDINGEQGQRIIGFEGIVWSRDVSKLDVNYTIRIINHIKQNGIKQFYDNERRAFFGSYA